jgi:hypothetical protein
MAKIMEGIGSFIFSLDTELAWGYFDLDDARKRLFSPDGTRERQSIARLLDIFDEYGIVATWAVIGHLFYDACELCAVCPVKDWQGKYLSYAEIYQTDHPLWYGADIIQTLLTRGARHEIAFHGYTHRTFDETTMSQKEARLEVQEWLRAGMPKGVVPRSVVFPRNRVGHLDVFERAGFICYRGPKAHPPTYGIPFLGKVLNRLDLAFQIYTPPVYSPSVDSSGLVNLPASQWLFGFDRCVETILDGVGLHRVRIRRLIDGVRKAADQRGLIHIWAHPFEFRSDKDFDKLRYLLNAVGEEIAQGRMQSVGMAELARWVIERHEQQSPLRPERK